MNDLQYLPRYAESLLVRALEASPVVVLMGARQTGKSTLVQTAAFLEGHHYLTLDDLDVRERAREMPDELLRSSPRLIIDEVQREPDLILAIKRAVDDDRPRKAGRFVLTGSANLLLMQRISETLAGRATYITLWPLTRRERLGQASPGAWSHFFDVAPGEWLDGLASDDDFESVEWTNTALSGGYPTPSVEMDDPVHRTIWFDGYVRTYLERDLQQLASIENLVDFRRLMKAASLRIGKLLNQAELGRDTGIPRPTVHRYLNLLETSFQVIRLEPYSVNRTRRLVKSPKLYWSDTGLAMHLGGETTPRGAHLESLVLTDLAAWRDGQIPQPQVCYWRTSTDLEVDFVIEHRERLLAIEVKASGKPTNRDIRALLAMRDDYRDRFLGGLLLHDGQKTEWLADRILALPWHRVI